MLINLSKKGQQGFTLVELLVAIAIIAILAVIGLTVFTGLQRSARDAQRRSDVEAIAKSLEANYNTTSAQYVTLAATMFAAGRLPTDPLAGTSNCAGASCQYCIAWSTGGSVNPADPGGAVSACGGTPMSVGEAGTGSSPLITVTTSTPSTAATGFLVCTNLEGGAGNTTASHYCQGNQR